MFGTDRDVDAIAEYADASVRVMSRRGSLAPISGRHGFNEWLYERWGNRGNAVYTFTGGLLTIALTPMAEVASPRNTIVGHYVGALVATIWLFVFGLQDHANVLVEGFSPARAAAVALSVACTGGILRLLRAAHPPAGATTVIVSAGLLHTASQLAALAGGVALLTLSAHVLNRLLGVPAPRWASPR
jgi:hypothetical protein